MEKGWRMREMSKRKGKTEVKNVFLHLPHSHLVLWYFSQVFTPINSLPTSISP